MSFLTVSQSVRIVTLIVALCTACSDSEDCADADGDTICDMDDVCVGNDLVGDSDGDGVCNDIDDCEGKVEDDTDGDGICDDIDICLGNDAIGDADGDGICADLDLCNGDDATGNTDGDGVCDDMDACHGNDAVGDADGDGICADLDLCLGDDAMGDADGDGVCDDIDICHGNDALGDADVDGICADLDHCLGDDATGDTDGDRFCDDIDVYDVAYPNEYTARITGNGFSVGGMLAVINTGHEVVDLTNVSVVSASDDHATVSFGCSVEVGTLLSPGESQGDLFGPIEALLVGQGLPITEPHTNTGLRLTFRMNALPAGDFDVNGSCVLSVDGIEVTIQILVHRIDSGSSITRDSVTRHSFF